MQRPNLPVGPQTRENDSLSLTKTVSVLIFWLLLHSLCCFRCIYTLYLMSDSYLGLDQQYDVHLNVTPASIAAQVNTEVSDSVTDLSLSWGATTMSVMKLRHGDRVTDQSIPQIIFSITGWNLFCIIFLYALLLHKKVHLCLFYYGFLWLLNISVE